MSVTFYGQVENGIVKMDNPELLEQFLKKKKDGYRIQITMEKESKDPSNEQWGYIYGHIYRVVSKTTGMTIEEVDREFKKAFAKAYMIQLPRGMELSKSNLSKEWLSNYIDYIIQYCAEQGINVDKMETKK